MARKMERVITKDPIGSQEGLRTTANERGAVTQEKLGTQLQSGNDKARNHKTKSGSSDHDYDREANRIPSNENIPFADDIVVVKITFPASVPTPATERHANARTPPPPHVEAVSIPSRQPHMSDE